MDMDTGCQQCLPEYWHPDIAEEETECRGMSRVFMRHIMYMYIIDKDVDCILLLQKRFRGNYNL